MHRGIEVAQFGSARGLPVIIVCHRIIREAKGGSVLGGSLGVRLLVLGYAREDHKRPDRQPEEADHVIVHQEELAGDKVRVAEAVGGNAALPAKLLDVARLVGAVGRERHHLNAHTHLQAHKAPRASRQHGGG